MRVYKKNSTVIRTIEEKDEDNVVNLFDRASFGCVGLNWDLKPSRMDMSKYIRQIVDKEDISSEILILEEKQQFVGFVTVSRPRRNIYKIGFLAVKKEERNKGYGTLLLELVNALALQDGCDVMVASLSSEIFRKRGFAPTTSTTTTKFIYHTNYNKTRTIKRKLNKIFVDYDTIKEERNKLYKQQIEEETQAYQKFLKSPLFDHIMKL